MTKRTHGLAALLSENMALRAEVFALIEILDAAENTGHVVSDWRKLLDEARQTRAYQAIAEQNRSIIDQVEEATDKTAIIDLLEMIPMSELRR